VVLDDRRLMIPPEIKHRRSREREVEVRHPFALCILSPDPGFRNTQCEQRSSKPPPGPDGQVTLRRLRALFVAADSGLSLASHSNFNPLTS
jgi:hypothetical protein